MEVIFVDKLKMHSLNKVEDNISKIAELFPNVITETIKDGKVTHAIDFDVLRQELSDTIVEGPQERYQFTWPNKRISQLLANRPTNNTLRPVKNESENYENTRNLYIEGDNLEVLKVMQESYFGKVKMIYIDPPYNTGKDSFVYEDDFELSNFDFTVLSNQFDEDGNMLFDIRNNFENNGRFHTDWLNMIYPRLRLAKDLLCQDGVIFISIDDNEYVNLKKVCDEIFGSENFLDTFHIQVRYGNKSLNEKDDFQKLVEYVLIYAKSRKDFVPKKEEEDYDLGKFNFKISEHNKPDRQIVVNGRSVDVFLPGSYSITKVTEDDTKSMEFFKETWITGSIYSGTGHGLVYQQVVEPRSEIDGLNVLYKIHGLGEDGLGFRYMTGPKQEKSNYGKMYNKIPLSKLDGLKAGTYKRSKPIINYYDYSPDFGNIRHEGGIAFNSGKKPIKFLMNLINIANLQDDDIVLDFFSGSASTAHAVLQLNVVDNVKRRFIMVQLPESTDPRSEAFKGGFINICEIGKERIRRSAEQLKKELGLNQNVDLGFRVLKLDSSNMQNVYYNPVEFEQTLLKEFTENIKSDRTVEDLLFQVMLDLGVLLSSEIQEHFVSDMKVFNVAHGYLLACFDENITSEVISEIAKKQPYYAVFRDSGMKDDSVLTNFQQIFNKYSPTTIRKVL